MKTSESNQGLKPFSATRFRFQSLLLATTVVAGIAALCGAYLRGASGAEQRCLLILWGSGAASFAIWMLGYTWQHRSEKKVGLVRFRLPWFVCLRTWLLSPKIYGMFFLLTAPFFIIFQTGQCAKYAERGAGFWQVAIQGLNPGLFAAIGFTCIWWHKEFWIGEQGITLLSSFQPWERIKVCYPHKKQDDTLVLELGLIGRKVAVRVPTELREQVDALIAEKLENEK
ncbi:MAG: hypothetical protein GXP28_01555 [Planctomycetes bacterium]|nr:hypothetical protein [Planctomycetota bacterium]